MSNIEVLKIDISKEKFALPAGTNMITARRLTGLWDEKKDKTIIGPIPKKELKIEIDKYHLHEFKDSTGHFPDTNFLVKEDDLGLFTQLLLLQTRDIKAMCERYEKQGYDKGYADGAIEGKFKMSQAMKAEWKEMSWFERLFNKF